jgi:hypothetical protein
MIPAFAWMVAWNPHKFALSIGNLQSGLLQNASWTRYHGDKVHCTGCSKGHETNSLLGICVSWTPHFKEIVASTIPGLKPPQHSFYGGISRILYSNYPHTLQELQANIERIVDRISTVTLQNVFANMIRSVNLCEERNGGHLQHLL